MILVLSPHGDDAELAMGGTMAALGDTDRVRHVVMTVSPYTASNGELVTHEVRMNEAALACRELGAEFHPGPFTDNDFIGQMSDIVGYIDGLLETYRPTEVYTCLPWFNEDHTVLYKATLAAMRKVGSRTRFWGYEMPAQQLGYTMPEAGWQYTLLSEGDLKRKLKALTAYGTQKLATKSGPVSMQGALKLAELRGNEVGFDWAERQLLLRGVRSL